MLYVLFVTFYINIKIGLQNRRLFCEGVLHHQMMQDLDIRLSAFSEPVGLYRLDPTYKPSTVAEREADNWKVDLDEACMSPVRLTDTLGSWNYGVNYSAEC